MLHHINGLQHGTYAALILCVSSDKLQGVSVSNLLDSSLEIYTVTFTNGDEWPCWAKDAQDAIEQARDCVPSLVPLKAEISTN